MTLLTRLLGVCGVQGIFGLGSYGMRTRCHLLTFTSYLFIYLIDLQEWFVIALKIMLNKFFALKIALALVKPFFPVGYSLLLSLVFFYFFLLSVDLCRDALSVDLCR